MFGRYRLRTPTLCGPRLLAPNEIAEAISKALNRRVKYHDVPLPMFLKAASSLGISEFVVSQLYWFLQDYQGNAFGVSAPTGVVEEIAGGAPEDFASIARRYVAASPDAIRGLSGALREVSGLVAALLTRKPDVGRVEERLGAPHVDGYALANKSPLWMATRAKAGRSSKELADLTAGG
jgi:NAD(P)H dehydrogenase (quinone)